MQIPPTESRHCDTDIFEIKMLNADKAPTVKPVITVRDTVRAARGSNLPLRVPQKG